MSTRAKSRESRIDPFQVLKQRPNPTNGKALTWVDPVDLRRGADDPRTTIPYESNEFLRKCETDRASRSASPQASYSEPTRYLKSSQVPTKIQWDGTLGSFREYRMGIEGYYISNEAGYIFNNIFQEVYCAGGVDGVMASEDIPRGFRIT